MKILLLNQFFWPDGSATSQLLTDLSRSLSGSGHQVTVICSDKGGYASADQADAPRARVYRVKSFPFVRGVIGRVLSYLSFYLSATFRGLLLPRQDIVLTLTTPPLLPFLGTIIKRLRGSRHFIWEMDMYPDVAVDLGYFKAGGVLDSVVGALADYSRRSANGIIALGDCMAVRLAQRSIPEDKIWVAHNWADGKAITPLAKPGDPDMLTLLYSGNIGLAHDFETILGSIEQLGDLDDRLQFLFRGTGARRQEISNFIERTQLGSISLGSFVTRSSLSASLAAGDIGLVTQREVCCGSVVPSKVYGLLAAGRPVLFIGPSQATPALINDQFGCGWNITPGDIAGLTRLLLHLANNKDEVELAGRLARQAFLHRFDMPEGIARILSILEERATSNSFEVDKACVTTTPELLHQ